MTATRILACMVGAIVALGAIAFVDARLEANAALADYAADRVAIARAASGILRVVLERAGDEPDDAEVLREASERLHGLEEPRSVRVLLASPSAPGLLALDGSRVDSPPIRSRLDVGDADGAWLRLAHDESAALGLPPRTGIATIAVAESRAAHPWSVVFVSSAHRERDREERSQWRIFVAFLLGSTLVVAFGLLALRKQRSELAREKRLALTDAARDRHEKLLRAEKLASFGALAASVAQQVRTPLGAIDARARSLGPRVAGDDDARRALDDIAEQAHRIEQLMRVFSALGRGVPQPLVRADPVAIARDAVDAVHERCAKAGVEVVSALDDALPLIACDRALFDQAIVSLLLDACDAAERGARITLSVRPNGELVAFVVDVDRALANPPASIGLAVAREIVNHHGASLTLEAQPSRGGHRSTRARIEIPAARTSDSA